MFLKNNWTAGASSGRCQTHKPIVTDCIRTVAAAQAHASPHVASCSALLPPANNSAPAQQPPGSCARQGPGPSEETVQRCHTLAAERASCASVWRDREASCGDARWVVLQQAPVPKCSRRGKTRRTRPQTQSVHRRLGRKGTGCQQVRLRRLRILYVELCVMLRDMKLSAAQPVREWIPATHE